MEFNITEFDTLDSTNTQASTGKYHHGDIVLAHWQSNGRGQRGNTWSSNAGENLMFSLVIEPSHIKVYQQYHTSIMAALAASDALSEVGADCRLKWPNDLYVGDNKIGGILIEHCSMGEYLSRSIIGVGINVLQDKFPQELPNPTSLILCEIESSPKALLETFTRHFALRYRQTIERLCADYMARLWRGEGKHIFSDKIGQFKASIHKINPNTGELSLLREDGTTSNYYFKEVEFVL